MKRYVGRMFAGFAAILLAGTPFTSSALTIDFQDLDTSIPPAQSYDGVGGVYYNGRPTGELDYGDIIDGTFTSGGVSFRNRYAKDAFFDFEFWGGFSYSNTIDNTTPGFENQYSAYVSTNPDGTSLDRSNVYVIGYADSFNEVFPLITLPIGLDTPISIQLANTTYVATYVLDNFEQGHWLTLTIRGFDLDGDETGFLDVYLADYRGQSLLMLTEWTTFDLSVLGTGVHEIEFTLDSNDAGAFGINAPLYFAADNFQVVPEPSSALFGAVAVVFLLGRRTRHESSC
jgi:hypothetical protein